MKNTVDCLLIGHYAMDIRRQVQLAEMANGTKSYYFKDSLEKRFLKYNNRPYTASQLYNLFYNENDPMSLSYDHTTFIDRLNSAVTQLGTYLVRDGHSIDFLNTFNERTEQFAEKLTNNPILTIAIVTTFYNSAFPIIEIIRYIRKYNKSARVIVGGPFIYNLVSSMNEDKLNDILVRLGADIYIHSLEGDDTLSEVVQAIKDNQKLDHINNILYNQNGIFRYTGFKRTEIKADKHLNAWDYFGPRMTKHVSVRTSISCPFNCNFCGLPGHGGNHRPLPIAEIEAELNKLYNAPVKPNIFFIDETFNYPVDRFKDMLKMMIKNKYNFKWEAEIRCQFVDEEMAYLMKESGCEIVFCGIESGNQEVLNHMNKRATVDEYYKGLAWLHKYDIMTAALLIIGFPGETEATFWDTYNFIEDAKPTFYRVHRWFYDLDTPIHLKRKEYDLNGEGYNWSHKTMDIATAHKLSEIISLKIKNSIHTADYPPVFDLICRGYQKEKAIEFLKYFDYAVREKCTNHSLQETTPELIQKLKTILK